MKQILTSIPIICMTMIPLVVMAQDDAKKIVGTDQAKVADVLSNLASDLMSQGRYAEAEPLLQRVLAEQEAAFGLENPAVAETLSKLGELYKAQKNFTEAEPLLKRALKIREATLELNHPDLLSSVIGLAALYTDQHRYAEAEPLHQRTVTMMEARFGTSHADVGRALGNLARTQIVQRKYAEAEVNLKRAQAIFAPLTGAGQLEYAKSLYELATLYHIQGDAPQAEALYVQSIKVLEPFGAVTNNFVSVVLNKMAALYEETGRSDEAAWLKERLARLQSQTQAVETPAPRTPPPDARRVMLRGRIQVEGLDFGGCVETLVMTIQNQNGAASYRSMLLNAQEYALTMIAGRPVTLPQNTKLEGFQVIPDAQGYYAVCDDIDRSITKISYTLPGFYYLSGCSSGKPQLRFFHLNTSGTINRPAKPGAKVKKGEIDVLSFASLEVTADQHVIHHVGKKKFSILSSGKLERYPGSFPDSEQEYDKYFSGQECQ